jgi:hypothetical protein
VERNVFGGLLMTILALLPLPVGVILVIALMWNELNRRNKIRKSMGGLLVTNEQKLIRECLDWLIDFQVTANLNDNAWERLGDLIDRCDNALKTNETN